MVTSDRFEEFPTPITIGVVADTHLRDASRPLPKVLLDGLKAVDLILHCGDVTTRPVLEMFEKIAPVRAVVGNNDEPSLMMDLPLRRMFMFGDFRVGMLHGHGGGRLTAQKLTEQILVGKVDIAVFGHSHRPLCEWNDGTLLFNPGSATDRRWEPRHSYGIIRIDTGIDADLHFY